MVTSAFKDWAFMSNYEFSQLGYIWVLWKSTARLSPVFKNSQIITCSVLLKGSEEEFLFCRLRFLRKEKVYGRICEISMILPCLEVNRG